MALQAGIPIGLLLILAVGLEAGYRIGLRPGSREAQAAGQVGAIQGAMLGLLGLLLGFSFAGAAGRYIERQDLILTEANAIGTAYLRADLLEAAHRSALREALTRYVEHRIRVSRAFTFSISEDAVAQVSKLHSQMWEAAVSGVAARPHATMAVLPPVNEVIDLHSSRVAAADKHAPALVLGLLAVCAVLSMGVIGYSCGLSRRRALMMTVPLVLLIGTALWTTIDLDYGRVGLIRISDAPLEQLQLGS